MVRVGIFSIQHPIANLIASIFVFTLAFTLLAEEELIARIIIIAAGFVLLGRAIFTFSQRRSQKVSKAEKFARFEEEDKNAEAKETVS